MTFIPATNLVAKAVIEGSHQGDSCVNTLWFEKTDETAWATSDLLTLVANLEDWWGSQLAPLLSTSLSIGRIYASRQDSPTSLFAELIPIALGGEVTGDFHPSNVAISVKFASSIMGRSYRGRNFVGGLPAVAVDGTYVDLAFKADLIAAYATLNTTVAVGLDAIHVVCSHYTNKSARTQAVTVPVQSYAIRKEKVNTMRSRVKD